MVSQEVICFKQKSGTYTNAVYGFLAIMFKILDSVKPDYLAVAFDMKAKTFRHDMYEEYKGTRKGMPDELAEQMPLIKEVLNAMNIKIIEKEGYEADDILGTLAKRAEGEGMSVIILSGDRDTFQLATDNITIRIPRTKAGKTEEDDYNREKVLEEYGVEPKSLIEVKGLMGDKSDNIPGIPGVGEKTALNMIREYKTIENIYEELEKGQALDIKGKLREKVISGKELAILSKKLGTIDVESPIEENIEELKINEWDKEKVLEVFTKLRFNKYIDKFSLRKEEVNPLDKMDIVNLSRKEEVDKLTNDIEEEHQMIYYLNLKDDLSSKNIIKKDISSIGIIIENKVYYIDKKEQIIENLKQVFENKEIRKIGYKLKQDYIVLKQNGVTLENFDYDIEIAGYILDSIKNKYDIETLSLRYLNLELENYIKNETKQEQLDLFSMQEEKDDNEGNKVALYAYAISKLYEVTKNMIQDLDEMDLLKNIEMKTAKVLACMQYMGIGIDKEELIEFGRKLKSEIEEKTQKIYNLCGKEFNINSTKQLGQVLFEDLGLPTVKKTKSGYSTDSEVLEKLKREHPVVEELLEYRQLVKLNSTYVEGIIPFINEKTGRIHSYFHQTVTATGRISSAEPNLQNIPTRFEMGKYLRKVFKPKKGSIFIDADYSQIELRIFAHIANDKNMIDAFINNVDIHKEVASKVFEKPLDEVTKDERTKAKAVNFGIIYGISDFGLGEQLGISRKEAKVYIEQYLEKYSGIKKFMENIDIEAKENGYVSTMFGRRRYIPELKSSNYMVRSFGSRAALNMPIQGTAADIMKLAMIEVQNKIEERNLKSRIVLQVHDELLLEVPLEEVDDTKELLKNAMENIVKLSVPLVAEVTSAEDWYGCK